MTHHEIKFSAGVTVRFYFFNIHIASEILWQILWRFQKYVSATIEGLDTSDNVAHHIWFNSSHFKQSRIVYICSFTDDELWIRHIYLHIKKPFLHHWTLYWHIDLGYGEGKLTCCNINMVNVLKCSAASVVVITNCIPNIVDVTPERNRGSNNLANQQWSLCTSSSGFSFRSQGSVCVLVNYMCSQVMLVHCFSLFLLKRLCRLKNGSIIIFTF